MTKRKKWYNIELPRSRSEDFIAFLREGRFIFEPSEAGKLIHFEIYAFDMGADVINQWLIDNGRTINRLIKEE